MQKKIDQHLFQGMQRDMSVSKQKAEFLWDAHNIRLTAKHGDTLFSITNERGTKKIDNISFRGVVLGYCVLGDYLTVFTTVLPSDLQEHEWPDYIYRIDKTSDGFGQKILYNGNLGFDVSNPIETLGVYENVDIQKVYWTDGKNQPRLINITKQLVDGTYIDTSFDFIPTLSLNDSIHVKKVADSSGLFPAGVIQYAVTYYNKYGQESNISVVSPLIPTSYTMRAGSPEDTIGNAFKVTIKNPDTNFEFLRLYSIFRSSKDTTPVCKRVTDVRLSYGGNTSKVLYKSDDAGSTIYARYSRNHGILFKEDLDSGFVALDTTTGSDYIGTENITVNNIKLTGNQYYHFTKENNPYLILKGYAYSSDVTSLNEKEVCFSWDTCTDIYISMNTPEGPGDGAHAIICVDGDNPVPKMYIASDINYSYTEFVSDGKVIITDNNTIGEDIDYNELLFVGGEEITAGTITQKDGTMFLGDITIKRPQITGNYNSISEFTIPTTTDGVVDDDLAKDLMVNVVRKGITNL